MKAVPKFIFLLGCAFNASALHAQDIKSFTDGRIAFDSVTNGRYRVEWKSTIDESNWQTNALFQDIIATGTTTAIAAPFYYRILWLNPPPYNISGVVRFAGTPLTNLADNVYIQNLDDDYEDQSLISSETALYGIANLSNGSYRITLTSSEFLPYEAELSLANDHIVHNIDLVIPVLPVAPTNGHAQNDTSISLEWEHNPYATRSHIVCIRTLPDWATIFFGWQMYNNVHQLDDLVPGNYMWRVDTSYYEQWFDLCGSSIIHDYPVGKFLDWQYFTILE